MKKLINSLLLMALMALTFNSCEDVPAPYGDPNNGGGTGTTAGEYLNSPFSSDFGDFTLKNISGTAWVIDYSTAKATGYDNTSQVYTPSESYLVSKEIDLTDSKAAYLQFEYIYRYKGNGTENKVLITDNYTGDPTTTFWDDITGTLVQGGDWSTFYTYAKNLDSKYLGKKKVVVALYYASTDKASATIEIKNLIMKEGTVTEPEVPETPAHDTTGAAGDGTKESPFNIPGANKYIADGGDANAEVYVKGKIVSISSIDTETYGNAEYFISDDGTDTNQLKVYRGYALGNKHFEAEDEIKVGDEVIVCGKLIDYNDTYEFGQGNYIYSLNGKVEETTGGGETGRDATISKDGTVITITDSKVTASTTTITCDLDTYGWENGKEPESITLSDGTTISFAQEDGNNAPKYYTATKGVRMYAKNSISIVGFKAIAKIVINCDSYNGTYYIGNDEMNTKITDNTWKVVNDYTSTSSGVQCRVKTIEITYAN